MIGMATKIELLIVFACIAFTSGDVIPPQPLPTNATTTPGPTTPATTSATTTTANTTTPSPTTPSPTTPSPTTPSPTTPSPTTPTTPSPTTPTTKEPTTPAVSTTPAPVPKPDIGKWSATNESDNKTYIMAEMAVQLHISHVVKNETKQVILDVPKNATATGNFVNDTQSLYIKWLNTDNTTNQFIILFEKNGTESRYMIKNITVNMTLGGVFPDIKDNCTILYSDKTEFSTPLHKSYRCAKEQTIDLMSGSNETFGAVTLSHVQLEAFHEKTDDLFDTPEDCERSSSSDVVPIAVGCALVGLVAIVLIAYLVGRRRSQTRGYLSM